MANLIVLVREVGRRMIVNGDHVDSDTELQHQLRPGSLVFATSTQSGETSINPAYLVISDGLSVNNYNRDGKVNDVIPAIEVATISPEIYTNRKTPSFHIVHSPTRNTHRDDQIMDALLRATATIPSNRVTYKPEETKFTNIRIPIAQLYTLSPGIPKDEEIEFFNEGMRNYFETQFRHILDHFHPSSRAPRILH